MMGFGQITHMKNKLNYKEKWATIYGDCKKDQDYMVGACRNEDYWNIIFEERGMEFVKSVQQNDL